MKMLSVKKILTVLTFSLIAALPLTAQESSSSSTKPIWDHGDNVSKITYQNAQIYKILDSRDAYVVIYARNGIKVGELTIPKSWAKTTPRKLNIRNSAKGIEPYVTVIKQDGEFLKVWLTIPNNRLDKMWGILPNGTELADLDKDSLQLEY